MEASMEPSGKPPRSHSSRGWTIERRTSRVEVGRAARFSAQQTGAWATYARNRWGKQQLAKILESFMPPSCWCGSLPVLSWWDLVAGGRRSQGTGRQTLALQCWSRSPCQTGEWEKESTPQPSFHSWRGIRNEPCPQEASNQDRTQRPQQPGNKIRQDWVIC